MSLCEFFQLFSQSYQINHDRLVVKMYFKQRLKRNVFGVYFL